MLQYDVSLLLLNGLIPSLLMTKTLSAFIGDMTYTTVVLCITLTLTLQHLSKSEGSRIQC
jgi:hypothetical protein